MFYGAIKSIAFERGFGFIGQEGGKDVYFHVADVGQEVFDRLRLDQPVAFEYAKRTEEERNSPVQKGPRAAKIKLIDRIPGGVLPPPPQELSPKHHPRARQRKATWKRKIDVRKSDS